MGETSRRIIGNGIWQLIQRIGGQLLAYAFVVLVARHLGVEQYGTYVYAVSFVNLFIVLADYGIPMLAVRDMARSRYNTSVYVSNIGLLKLFLVAATFSVIYAAMKITAAGESDQQIIIIIALYFMVDGIGTFFGCVFQAIEKMSYNAIIEILQRLFILSLSSYLLYSGQGLVVICWILFLSALLHSLTKAILVHFGFARLTFSFEPALWKNVIKEGLPMAVIAAISMIYYNIDMIMLKHMHGEQAVGWYGVSFQLFFALSTVTGSFLTAVFPAMSKYYISNHDNLRVIYNKCFKLISGFGLPVTVGGIILSDKIIHFLFGLPYQKSEEIFAIFSGVIVFSLLGGLFAYTLTSTDRQNAVAWLMAATTVLNIVLNLFLIPRYAYYGAAWATVTSQMVFFGIGLLLVPGKFRSIPAKSLIKICCSTAFMGLLLNALEPVLTNLFALVSIGGTVYLMSFFLIGGLDSEDRRLLLSFMPKFSDSSRIQ